MHIFRRMKVRKKPEYTVEGLLELHIKLSLMNLETYLLWRMGQIVKGGILRMIELFMLLKSSNQMQI